MALSLGITVPKRIRDKDKQNEYARRSYHKDLGRTRTLRRKKRAANRERINAQARDRAQSNIEATRKKWREAKRRIDPEKRRALYRDYYARNKERARQTIYAGRIRRNPAYGLDKAVNEFIRGSRSIDSLDQLYRDRLALLHEKNDGASGSGSGSVGPRVGKGKNDRAVRGQHQPADANATKNGKAIRKNHGE